MKARCIHLVDASGKAQGTTDWLTVGKVYHVLEVVQERGRWLLRIMADEPNGLALFQLEQFEIVTSTIPPSWVISWGKNGYFKLTPQTWCHTGFWERYYDRHPETIRIFEMERRKIIEIDP